MGQLIAGLLLGPSVLGALLPDFQHALFPAAKEQKAMIDAVAQFGILCCCCSPAWKPTSSWCGKADALRCLLRSPASSCRSSAAWRWARRCPTAMLPDPGKRLITSLFLGTALSIASVKIVATVIREMNFMRRTVGQVILASAIIDDTVGWIIVSIIFSLALQGQVDAFSIAQERARHARFHGPEPHRRPPRGVCIIRWVNDNFVSDFAVITAILLIMCAMASITDLIGVHTVLGAFVAGILVGESPILTRHIDEQLRGLIIAFFMPVFFGIAGLSADLTVLKDPIAAGVHRRPDRDRKPRKIQRRISRRRAWRAHLARSRSHSAPA